MSEASKGESDPTPSRPNLLDLVDELSDLPLEQRRRRLDDSGLNIEERRKVEKWLGAASGSSQFLQGTPDTWRSLLAEHGMAPEQNDLPPAIDGYRMEKLLGRGAMGIVWKAHDLRLEREVAIKVLSTPGPAGGEIASRFLREARAAAKLNHPNTVTIHQIIEQGGRIFIAMELLEGASLAERLAANGPIPWREAAQAMRDAAAGLQAAHEAGLVHRDVKPSNLMRTVRGTVKVVDFGVARNQAATMMTSAGALIGTPAYMSPEQCEGKEADPRSDLYSLGCAFFCLISGRMPFNADTVPSILYQHVHAPPPDLGDLASNVPHSFRAILRRCMAKAPADRFASAGELASELDRLLASDEPAGKIVVKPPRSTPSRWRKRIHEIWPVLSGGLAIVCIAPVLIYWLRFQPQANNTSAPPVRVAAMTSLPATTQTAALSTTAPTIPATVAASPRIVDLMPLIDPVRDSANANWEQTPGGLRSNVFLGRLEIPYQPPEEYDFYMELTSIAGSELYGWGQLIPKAAKHLVWAANDRGKSCCLSLGSAGETRVELNLGDLNRHTSEVRVRRGRVTALIDGREILDVPTDYSNLSDRLGGQIGGSELGIFGAATFHVLRVTEISGPGRVRAHARDDQELLRALPAGYGPVSNVAFSRDGNVVLSVPRPSREAFIRTWGVYTGIPAATLRPTHYHAISPDSLHLLGPQNDVPLSWTEINTTAMQIVLSKVTDPIRFVAFSRDGTVAALCNKQGKVRLLDATAFPAAKDYGAPIYAPATALAFSPAGDLLALADEQGARVRLWDIANAREVSNRNTEALSPRKIVFNAFGALFLELLAGSKNVWVFDVREGGIRARLTHASEVHDAEFSSDGQFMYTADPAGIHLWDLASGLEIPRFDFTGEVLGIAAARIDRRLLAACADGTVRLFDTDTGKQLRKFAGHDKPVTSVAFSPDEQLAASGSEDRTVRLWKLSEKSEIPNEAESYLRGLGIGYELLQLPGGPVQRFTIHHPIVEKEWARLSSLLRDADEVILKRDTDAPETMARVLALPKRPSVTVAGF